MTSTTLIIPTRDRLESLCLLLQTLGSEVDAETQVIVVDQSKEESYFSLINFARSLPFTIEVIRQPIANLPIARNTAFSHSRGEVIVYIDDDVIPQQGWLFAHRRAYADSEVGAVVGRIVETPDRANAATTANRITRWGRVITNLDSEVRREVQLVRGANMSFRRVALLETGGFNPAYRGNFFLEDADVGYRVRCLGWKVLFEPHALVVHEQVPDGGCRLPSSTQVERWRFQNTGYFQGIHRSLVWGPATAGGFAAIAAKRAVEWKDPMAFLRLMNALRRGYWQGVQDRFFL